MNDNEEERERSDRRIGRVFNNRFEIVEKIGVGGMGTVYRGRQLGLGRTVVIKILHAEHQDKDSALQRFEREARSLSQLDDQNIVSIYDLGQEGELNYIVMEYVDGEQLDEFIEREGPLEVDDFFPIAAQLASAVGEAHQVGLVHRDLKPSNILLTERRGEEHFVKVLDFGLAKSLSGGPAVTKEENLVGSIPYLSPEQISGDETDQRIDVYALGIVMYYLLTGRKPFEGSEATVLYAHVHEDPPPLAEHIPEGRSLPPEVTDLVTSCLDKDPDKRPDDGQEVFVRLCNASESTNPMARFFATSSRPDVPRLEELEKRRDDGDPEAQEESSVVSPPTPEPSTTQAADDTIRDDGFRGESLGGSGRRWLPRIGLAAGLLAAVGIGFYAKSIIEKPASGAQHAATTDSRRAEEHLAGRAERETPPKGQTDRPESRDPSERRDEIAGVKKEASESADGASASAGAPSGEPEAPVEETADDESSDEEVDEKPSEAPVDEKSSEEPVDDEDAAPGEGDEKSDREAETPDAGGTGDSPAEAAPESKPAERFAEPPDRGSDDEMLPVGSESGEDGTGGEFELAPID